MAGKVDEMLGSKSTIEGQSRMRKKGVSVQKTQKFSFSEP